MKEKRQDFAINSVAIELEFPYEASPEKLWRVLTERMGDWWREPYSMVEKRESFELELRAGGRVLEVGDGGSQFLWGNVTAVKHNERLELTGPIGMNGLVHGWVRFKIAARGKASTLMLTHHVFGEVDADTASNYHSGWKEMLAQRVPKLF